jgi:hypothetical protein
MSKALKSITSKLRRSSERGLERARTMTQTPTRRNFMSTIKEVVDDLLNPKISVQEAMDRHFASAFRQRINGNWVDRAAFLEGIGRLRETLDHAELTVLDEVFAGEHYAERHFIDLIMRDGTSVRQEVYIFARRDSDGRFMRIEEAIQTTA